MSFPPPSSGLLPGAFGHSSENANNTKREAALVEAAALVLQSLPPTYPFRVPPPHSVIVDSNPLTLSGQLSAIYSLAANTSRRLANLNNQFLSPLIGDVPREAGDEHQQEFGLTMSNNPHYNYLGMTTNFGATAGQLGLLGIGESGGTPLYGKILKPFILDYHYRNTSIVPIDADVASVVFGPTYVQKSFVHNNLPSHAANTSESQPFSSAISIANHSSRDQPPLGLLLSPNTQIVQRMRRAARNHFKKMHGEEGAGCVGEVRPRSLSVTSAEDFLTGLWQSTVLSLTYQGFGVASGMAVPSQGSLERTQSLSPNGSGSNASSPPILNVYTRPMAPNDIRLTGIDVTHLFALPLSLSQYEARKGKCDGDPSISNNNNNTTTNTGPSPAGRAPQTSAFRNDQYDPTFAGRYAFFAEVDMIEVEIIRVWRIDVVRARAEATMDVTSSSSTSTSSRTQTPQPFSLSSVPRGDLSREELLMLLAVAADEGSDAKGNAIASAVLEWTLGKGFGNAKQIGVSVARRVGVAAGEELSSFVLGEDHGDGHPNEHEHGQEGDANNNDDSNPRPLYAVNIAAQLWSENIMSAVTYRVGLSVDGATLLPSLPNCSTVAAGGGGVVGVNFLPSSVLISNHVDVWLLVADYDWTPNTDMCKTHVMNAFTAEEVAKVVRRIREEKGGGREVNVVASEGQDAAASSEVSANGADIVLFSQKQRLGAILDALHVRTIWACDERLCCEKDAKHVWLQHLRCQLPPTKNLFVFRESMPPQRPGFAVKH